MFPGFTITVPLQRDELRTTLASLVRTRRVLRTLSTAEGAKPLYGRLNNDGFHVWFTTRVYRTTRIASGSGSISFRGRFEPAESGSLLRIALWPRPNWLLLALAGIFAVPPIVDVVDGFGAVFLLVWCGAVYGSPFYETYKFKQLLSAKLTPRG